MWVLGQHTLLGIVVGLCGGLRRHTSLGIVVGLCEASGNTLNWVLLVYVAPRATHFTGYCWFMWGTVVGYVAPWATHFTAYCCWFMRGLGQHTLLGIVVGYARVRATHFTGHHYYIRSDVGRLYQWVQNNLLFFKIIVEKSKCRFPYTEANIPSQKNHMSLLPGFLN
jgi:hypothetical protein